MTGGGRAQGTACSKSMVEAPEGTDGAVAVGLGVSRVSILRAVVGTEDDSGRRIWLLRGGRRAIWE